MSSEDGIAPTTSARVEAEGLAQSEPLNTFTRHSEAARQQTIAIIDALEEKATALEAWTTEVRDEHSLLGSVLTALLLHPFIAVEHLRGPFATVRPLPTVHLRTGDGTENSDFWSALGGQLKPGLDLVVTATVDAAAFVEAGPPVRDIEVTATRFPDPAETAAPGIAPGVASGDRSGGEEAPETR